MRFQWRRSILGGLINCAILGGSAAYSEVGTVSEITVSLDPAAPVNILENVSIVTLNVTSSPVVCSTFLFDITDPVIARMFGYVFIADALNFAVTIEGTPVAPPVCVATKVEWTYTPS